MNLKNKKLNEIIGLVQSKIPGSDLHFTVMMIMNKMAQISANMRVKVHYMDGTLIPVNFYGMMLANSGIGKGKITNLLEDNITGLFEEKFMKKLAPEVSEDRLNFLAEQKAISEGLDQAIALNEILKEWNKLPKHLYSFSDATIEGTKAKRVKLSMIELGATNLEIDEIALNIERVSEVLALFLEAYDLGKAKQKLIKVDSNSESLKVPANAFFFGTPARLLNGGKIEKIFIDLLANGFGRRMFYGIVDEDAEIAKVSSQERLSAMRDMTVVANMDEIKKYFAGFADKQFIGKVLPITDDVATALLDYEDNCLERAKSFKSHQEIEKAEMSHRYWKTIKAAGILCFIDNRDMISIEDIQDAISIAEESGLAFEKIMNRPANHERLLDFILEQERKLTQADLVEQLHFYGSTSKQQKEEMLVLASAFAYNNNAVIKRNIIDGIEFISAQKLKSHNESETILSISTHITENYDNRLGKFADIKNILKSDFNYSAHHFKDGYRTIDNSLPDFNIIILDIDEDVSIQMAMALLGEYKYIMGTTRSHQKEKNGEVCDRFRIVMPLDRTLSMNGEEFTEFMKNIMNWLPFEVDRKCVDAARFYFGNPDALIFENDGNTIESIDFIPNTSKAEEKKRVIADLSNLDELERWFALSMSKGSRNNNLARFAFMLCDAGLGVEQIEERVLKMNETMTDKLPEKEIYGTIMKSVTKKLQEVGE